MKWIWLLLLWGCCWGEGRTQDLEDLSYEELDSLADLEYKKGDYTKSILCREKIMTYSEGELEIEDTIYLNSMNDLGVLYIYTGQYKKAKKTLLETIIKKAAIIGIGNANYAESLNNLAALYSTIDSFKQAESFYIEARDIILKVHGESSYEYAQNLSNLSNLYQDIGEYTNVEKLLLMAIEIYEKKEINHPDYAIALNNLAAFYRTAGNYFQAELLYLKSKAMISELFGKKHPNYAQHLNSLAVLYHELGNYSQAELLYNEAKNVWGEIFGKEHSRYAICLSNLGVLYQYIEKQEKAEECLLEGERICKKVLGGNNLEYARILNNLGLFYLRRKSYIKAERVLLKVKNIKLKLLGSQNLEFANALSNLANLRHYTGDYKEAELLHLRAQDIYLNTLGKKHPRYVINRINLGSVYIDMEKLDNSFICLMESINANTFQVNKLSDICIDSLCLYNYYSKRYAKASINTLLKSIQFKFKKRIDKKELQKFYRITQQAMYLNERFRNEFSSEDDKLRVLKNENAHIENGIKTAFLLGKKTYKKEAFSFAEQNKSILLADAIKGNRARQFGDLPDTLVERELQLQKELKNLKKQEYTVKTPEGKIEVNRALGELSLVIDAFLKSLKDKYPKYHALKYENITAKAGEVQDLLDEETLLLEYFQVDSVLYLFAVNKDSVEIYPIRISKAIINEKVGKLRKTLSDYFFILEDENKAYQEYTKAAHWFYKELLAVALKDKSIKNLIIITDGELGHLPFEAFLTESVPTKKAYKDLPYLMNQYNVSYNYSATLWKENLKEKNRTSNGQMLACAATYEGSIDSSFWNTRLPYYFSLRGDSSLSPLSANKEEIRALSNNFYGKFLIGESANERFFKENASNYSIIHLAMHGLANTHTPMLSSLAFTEDGDSVENNFLQAYEISQMKLNADLVVLSACETGYGKFRQGEGIVSLARAFMYAGAPSLVISLWQVNDASTAIIMQSFYEYLAQGKTKSGALRQAKLDYLKEVKGIKAHPAFWSAFIQLGNDAPIELQRKLFVVRYRIEIIWGVIMSLLLSGYVYKRRQKKQLL